MLISTDHVIVISAAWLNMTILWITEWRPRSGRPCVFHRIVMFSQAVEINMTWSVDINMPWSVDINVPWSVDINMPWPVDINMPWSVDITGELMNCQWLGISIWIHHRIISSLVDINRPSHVDINRACHVDINRLLAYESLTLAAKYPWGGRSATPPGGVLESLGSHQPAICWYQRDTLCWYQHDRVCWYPQVK